MRDANEETIRNELRSTQASYKAELEKLKQTVRARDEEISSLKASVVQLKKKYSSEATMKEELLKQLQTMSAASRTSVPSMSANNNS
jgi:chromosome segregation ATPase